MKTPISILWTLAALTWVPTALASSLVVTDTTAQLVTLRYGLQENPSNLGSASNVSTSPGSTTIGGSGYLNYANINSISGTSKAVFETKGSGYFTLDASSGINAGGTDVFSTTTGFTLVFNGYGSTSNWGDFLSITIGNASYKFETTSTTAVAVYQSAGGSNVTDKGSISNIARQTWYNFSLTVLGSNYTFSAWNTSGTLVSSLNFTGEEGNLTKIYEGAHFSQHYYSNYLDNIGLYDGVLTDAQLSQLVLSEAAGTGMIQQFANPIPEPATTGLSLLSLVGLAARRRRK